MTATTAPTCMYDVNPCEGARISPHDRCLAHLSTHERASFLQGLTAGSDLDFSGVIFTQELVDELTPVLRRIGGFNLVQFSGAQFLTSVDLSQMSFQGDCLFDNATFHESVTFERSSFQSSGSFLRCKFLDAANFSGSHIGSIDFSEALFKSADFSKISYAASLNFHEATFSDFVTFEQSHIGYAHFTHTKFHQSRFWSTTFTQSPAFNEAQFSDHASFEKAAFEGGAEFAKATFKYASFREAKFSELASFRRARFGSATMTRIHFRGIAAFNMAYIDRHLNFAGCRFDSYFLGPLRAQHVNMANTVFQSTVRIEISAESLNLHRAKFEAPAAFHVRHAVVKVTDINPTFPITIASHGEQFEAQDELLPDNLGSEPLGKLRDLTGADGALMILNDIDLRQCRFEGAYHLDQISLEGRCRFSSPPRKIKWGKSWLPMRIWTQRKVLEEERSWRASTTRHALDRAGWGDSDRVADVQDIAAIYRQLRKALEDGLNEPGAADFYYGEMEMRRRDDEISRSERGLLHAYWALSGYGLRASRSIGWLLSAMAVTVLLMTSWGIPGSEPKQQARGVIAAPGTETTFVVNKSDPTLELPVKKRYTGERLEKAGQVVLNSVVFRSSGQDLTRSGTWIEMVSRFTEPVLLGFAALAVRGRIKRS
ncbi:pentapeptide repeat-containing protein [Streptomyces massasporeus]|uniref:pentapeptide repeat-containing protein n=1 Tax=Streptomyces massasporeus TaxID=67324 RepID=UPI0036F57282